MDALLSRRAQMIRRLHDGDLLEQHADIPVREQQQTRHQLRHMDLPQRAADILHGRRGDQQKRRQQTENALHHQRQHRNNAARHGDIPEPQHDLPVKQRVEQSHRAHQRHHHAQLMKARAQIDPGQRIARGREQRHPHERRKGVLRERYRHDDIKDRDEQLAQRAQPVHRRVLRGQLVHRAQLRARPFGLVHGISLPYGKVR